MLKINYVYFLLTCAHAISSIGDFDEDTLEEVNRSFYLSYSRKKSKCYLDYALLPCSSQFIQHVNAYDDDDEPFRNILFHGRFATMNEYEEFFLLELDEESCDASGNVLWAAKRGIVTGETCGIRLRKQLDGSVPVEQRFGTYSRPGDSGALVSCIIKNVLYPVGIHFQGGMGTIGYYIPLDTIFQDFMVKNGLTSARIEFVRPFIRGGVLHVNRKDGDSSTAPLLTTSDISEQDDETSFLPFLYNEKGNNAEEPVVDDLAKESMLKKM